MLKSKIPAGPALAKWHTYWLFKNKGYLGTALIKPVQNAVLIARAGVGGCAVSASHPVKHILGVNHVVSVYVPSESDRVAKKFVKRTGVYRVHAQPIVLLGGSYNTGRVPVAGSWPPLCSRV